MRIGDTAMDLQRKRKDMLRIAAQYGARNPRVFGSVARGDDRSQSDVDWERSPIYSG